MRKCKWATFGFSQMRYLWIPKTTLRYLSKWNYARFYCLQCSKWLNLRKLVIISRLVFSGTQKHCTVLWFSMPFSVPTDMWKWVSIINVKYVLGSITCDQQCRICDLYNNCIATCFLEIFLKTWHPNNLQRPKS